MERRRPQFTADLKNQVAQHLLLHSTDGHLFKGAQKAAADLFQIHPNSVFNIWKQAKQQMRSGQAINLPPRKSGYKHKDAYVLDVAKVKSLPPRDRSTYRKLAVQIDVSKTQVGKWVKQKKLRAHTSAVKPLLTEANKIGRLKFSLSHLIGSGTDKLKFNNMKNVVHIDEKWFYMNKITNRFYLLPDEEDPYTSCKSKRFIPKIMFMCAVSRPHIEGADNVLFDGKIGIFPFTEEIAAKRGSKNREKGTKETKAIQSITKEVLKDCILKEIIPAIKAKWPVGASKSIFIQQDNAKPHFKANDPDFIEAANSDGFRIQLICQPPNSPDTNINDLSFFRAIQSLQDNKRSKTVDALLQNVKSSFEELSATSLNNVFVTLQSCYIEIMKDKGGNKYKIPHLNKERMIRLGILPESLEVDRELVCSCLNYLLLPENDFGGSYDMQPLMLALGF